MGPLRFQRRKLSIPFSKFLMCAFVQLKTKRVALENLLDVASTHLMRFSLLLWFRCVLDILCSTGDQQMINDTAGPCCSFPAASSLSFIGDYKDSVNSGSRNCGLEQHLEASGLLWNGNGLAGTSGILRIAQVDYIFCAHHQRNSGNSFGHFCLFHLKNNACATVRLKFVVWKPTVPCSSVVCGTGCCYYLLALPCRSSHLVAFESRGLISFTLNIWPFTHLKEHCLDRLHIWCASFAANHQVRRAVPLT